MTREEVIEYWDGLRKTFSSRLEKEENCFGRMHLQTTIDVLDVTLACLREQEERRWIPVKERLPDQGDRVLCVVKSFAFPGRKYYNILRYDKYGFNENGIYTDDVTHWMPLPEPPKEEPNVAKET